MESKHEIIRSIFLELYAAEQNSSLELHALRPLSILDDLYGNDMMSTFDFANEFTKLIAGEKGQSNPDDIALAQAQL